MRLRLKSGFVLGLVVGFVLLTVGSVLADEPTETSIDEALRAEIVQSSRLWANDDEWDVSGDDNKEKASSFGGKRKGEKSVLKAAGLSLLVPGGGQFYVGYKKRAYYFFAAEAVTWIGYASFRMYGDWKKDDYIGYAATYANAQLNGKSDEFIDWVGFYDNIEEFNDAGRVTDPDRPYLYDTPSNHWDWQDGDYQQTFRDLKNSSREAYRNADFMIGIAIVDRILSVIDAVRVTRLHNRQLDTDEFGLKREKPKLKFSVNPFSRCSQVRLTLVSNF